MNRHIEQFDKIIKRERQRTDKGITINLCDDSNETIINEFSSNTFTNYIYRTVIPDSYMKRYNCIECGEPAKNRCHGIGEERPLLLERALNKIRANNVEKIKMIDLKIAFIEEHKNTSFDFKCVECHKNEKIIII